MAQRGPHASRWKVAKGEGDRGIEQEAHGTIARRWGVVNWDAYMSLICVQTGPAAGGGPLGRLVKL